MAKAKEIYSSMESRAFLQAETTAMTANVATMYELPLSGVPSISENAYRENDAKLGAGRTIKALVVPIDFIFQIRTNGLNSFVSL